MVNPVRGHSSRSESKLPPPSPKAIRAVLWNGQKNGSVEFHVGDQPKIVTYDPSKTWISIRAAQYFESQTKLPYELLNVGDKQRY